MEDYKKELIFPENGARFVCDTQEQFESFISSGWTVYEPEEIPEKVEEPEAPESIPEAEPEEQPEEMNGPEEPDTPEEPKTGKKGKAGKTK